MPFTPSEVSKGRIFTDLSNSRSIGSPSYKIRVFSSGSPPSFGSVAMTRKRTLPAFAENSSPTCRPSPTVTSEIRGHCTCGRIYFSNMWSKFSSNVSLNGSMCTRTRGRRPSTDFGGFELPTPDLKSSAMRPWPAQEGPKRRSSQTFSRSKLWAKGFCTYVPRESVDTTVGYRAPSNSNCLYFKSRRFCTRTKRATSTNELQFFRRRS
mmetsp:Transcript_5216/g.14757  ORF Transcript_5216/g.14757 Transcript_5216/m.14757 type:complete len:208 (-) Transcript_5216:222-845(-)